MSAYRGGLYDVTKLLDFGLVKTLARTTRSTSPRKEPSPVRRCIWLPSRSCIDKPPDRRTDIYGLGAVAYFILTGRPPFLGESAMAVMVAHARDAVTPPSQLQPGIPADLERVVLQCLAKNPDERYPDTTSLAEALQACADAPNWSPRHALDWWQSHQNGISAEDSDPKAAPPSQEPSEAEVSFQSVDAPRFM